MTLLHNVTGSVGLLMLCGWLSLSAVAGGASPAPPASDGGATARARFQLSAGQKGRLVQALQPLHESYDPEARMLRQPFSSPGYHTTLKGGTVHSTRAALNYAVALLDTGEERWVGRAQDILRRVIALQDQNPSNKTYGIWSWFLEEPLDKMSPPDWNWADFCGTALLQVALDHRERLDPDVRKAVDEAIQHAARSIQRRNVGPGYTNIAIMGSYVTLVASELYEIPGMKEYAQARWRRFYDYTLQQGSFTEYNSPTYTIVALKELGRMLQHVRDPEARRMTETIYQMAWREIAQHWHAPTRQWAGPHSRCYRTLLGDGVPGLIRRATDGRVPFPDTQLPVDEVRLSLPCPREFEPLFLSLDQPREVVQPFVKGDRPVIGTTYLHPAFALGSVNRGDLWNQRRALLAYWGSAAKPSYLQVRMMRDGYDFAAAQFFSIQKQGKVLAAINFAVDGGNTHVSLDRLTNGTFKARDLRLRFEFGGAAGEREWAVPTAVTKRTEMKLDGVKASIQVPFIHFPDSVFHWEKGREKDRSNLDMVLHSGAEIVFDLRSMEAAVMAVAVEFAPGDLAEGSVLAGTAHDRLHLDWETLHLEVPTKPAKAGELQSRYSSR